MKYYVDGFIDPKNGSAKSSHTGIGGGYSIVDETGKVLKRVHIAKNGITSNQCELLAIREGANIADEGDTISTDSQCGYFWVRNGKSNMKGNKLLKTPSLNSFIYDTQRLFQLKGLNLVWEERDKNLAGKYNEKVKRQTKYKSKNTVAVIEKPLRTYKTSAAVKGWNGRVSALSDFQRICYEQYYTF